MSIDLLALLQEKVGGALNNFASSQLGESPSMASKAVSQILTALLGKLAGQTDQAVRKISDGIGRVVSTIEAQFREQLDKSISDAEDEALRTVAEQFNEVSQSYTQLIEHEGRILDAFRESSARLAEMFMETMASVQFQDVTRQQVGHVIEALQRLDEHVLKLADCLADKASVADIPAMTEQIDRLFESYVMQSQRDEHARHSATPGPAATAGGSGPAVELF